MRILLFATLLWCSSSSLASDLSSYVGYTIIYSGTVTGYIDEDGNRQDDFEGCEYGRRLIIDEQFQITCATYSYSYAYWPEVVILQNDSFAIAIIDGDVYDVSL